MGIAADYSGEKWHYIHRENVSEWSEHTKAMEIEGVGCLVQTIAEYVPQNMEIPEDGRVFMTAALTFVPGVCLEEIKEANGNVLHSKLVKIKCA